MNRIQELIKELCPNGVEWKKLGEVASYSKTRISASLLNESNYISVENLLQNCAGKVNSSCCPKEGNWIKYSCGDILIGNIRPNLRKIWLANIDGGTNGDVLVLHIDAEYALLLNPSFLYYILSSEKFFLYHIKNAQGGKMPRGDKASVLKYEIPLPPLPVQTEIVRILDKFVEQQEQLEKLIELRTKQYEYYREEMLTAKEGEEWETKTLGECCKILKGKYITQKDSKPGPYPVVLGGQEPAYYIDEFNHSGEVIAVSRSGVSAGFISYWNQDIFVSDGFMLEPLDCSFKYLYMYLKSKQESINSLKRGAGIPHITTEHLKELVIPIFPSSKENEIVNALDSFESSISALTSALELSKKRYEHYRDEMLRF